MARDGRPLRFAMNSAVSPLQMPPGRGVSFRDTVDNYREVRFYASVVMTPLTA